MSRVRNALIVAVALATGSTLAIGLASPAGATITPPPVPQFVIRFEAIGTRSVVPPVGLLFRSTACVIGSPTHPLLVNCQESGHVVLNTVGGLGTASLSSVLAGINWNFTLTRATATGATTYLMSGTGTESLGASPITRPVRVTGRITVVPTPNSAIGPLVKGTEAVYPLLPPA